MAMQHGHHHHYGYVHEEHNAPRFGHGSAYGAYAFSPGDEFSPGNAYEDFDRRNTFN
jgi:hypothetical protein